MNKLFFRLLVLLMSLSLIGIILVQVYWFNTSFNNNDEQFKFHVKQVISDVANKNYPEVIQSVFSKYKVKEQTRSLESTGRILEFDISCSMYDCLAYEETNGFFDECDCPPPEFWIAYIDDKLFAYIPKEHLDIANLGVEISMSGSLQWVQTLVD